MDKKIKLVKPTDKELIKDAQESRYLMVFEIFLAIVSIIGYFITNDIIFIFALILTVIMVCWLKSLEIQAKIRLEIREVGKKLEIHHILNRQAIDSLKWRK